MGRHPTDRSYSRRQFLRRAGGAAFALPSMAAILAACAKPGQLPEGVTLLPPARQDQPVTLPTYGREAIPTETPLETGATLQVYNWADYFYKKTLKAFGTEFDSPTPEYTTFNNMEEGMQKISAGQIRPDVFVTDIDKLNKLVEAKLIQPINHDLIPNLKKNIWPVYQDPFYDQGWQYTVPYVTWTTGIGYRRDHISDEEVAAKGYDILWDPQYYGKTGFYDDYRAALGMALIRNGVENVNTGNEKDIKEAADALLALLQATNARIAINNAYVLLPDDDIWVTQAWSGDMVGAKYYLPKGVDENVLGYWYPEARDGAVNNDVITIPANSENPALAHAFLNYMLEEGPAFQNFADWVGYQPPQDSINPASLIKDKVVPASMPDAVVTQKDFATGRLLLELEKDVDQLWFDAWDEVTSGG